MRLRVTTYPLLLLVLAAPLHAGHGEDRGYDVLDYHVAIDVDRMAGTITGDEEISLASQVDSLATIRLDAEDIEITGLRAGMSSVAWREDSAAGEVVVSLPEPLGSGARLRLSLTYRARPKRGVTFTGSEVYTQFHTHRWMPCNDVPADKATLTLAITLPSSDSVVANGRETARSVGADGRITHTWRNDSPCSPYLFGFAAGRFRDTTLMLDGIAVRLLAANYTAEQLTRIFASTGPALRFFADRAGAPFGFPGYAQVLVDGKAAQELAGFTVISESYGSDVLGEPREDWLVAHELAHQWWGSSLTCGSWSEIWLNEGMATFMEAALKESMWGREEYDREMMLARFRYERARSSGNDRPLRFDGWKRAEEANGTIPYNKGALVLDLLRFDLGEEAFWGAIRSYTREHAGGIVTGKDLRSALESTSGRSLERFFAQWVEGAGVPRLVARSRVEHGELTVEIEQQGDTLWELPLQVAIETASGRDLRRVELRERTTIIRSRLDDSLLSLRLDDGGHLPVAISYERPIPMLLYQLRREPDVAGRVDALLALTRTGRDAPERTVAEIHTAISAAAERDSSRLVRSLAARELERWKLPAGSRTDR